MSSIKLTQLKSLVSMPGSKKYKEENMTKQNVSITSSNYHHSNLQWKPNFPVKKSAVILTEDMFFLNVMCAISASPVITNPTPPHFQGLHNKKKKSLGLNKCMSSIKVQYTGAILMFKNPTYQSSLFDRNTKGIFLFCKICIRI